VELAIAQQANQVSDGHASLSDGKGLILADGVPHRKLSKRPHTRRRLLMHLAPRPTQRRHPSHRGWGV